MSVKQSVSRIAQSFSIICLLLLAVLLAGCTTSRNYPGPVHGLTFNGSIKSIDLKESRLTVAPLKAGEPAVFAWDDDTKFWKKGDPIKADVLEITWPVRIHYHESSGRYTAHHVYVDLTYPIVH
jgi:hypothetical protein